MGNVKKLFLKSLALGSHSDLSEGKKFALQVAVLDGYWSLVAFLFYAIFTVSQKQFELFYYHTFSCVVMVIGLWLIHKRHYDIARPLIHLGGLFGIFYCNDAFGIDSGFEYYYFTSIMMPHLTFSLDEIWKGIPLSAAACITFISQQIYGTGLLVSPVSAPPEERLIAIIIVVMFVLSVLSIARWRLYCAQKEVNEKNENLLKATNLIALGEVSAGIAHEINNPLQSLSLNLSVMKEKFPNEDFNEHHQINEGLIQKMGKIVQGLKELSRNDEDRPTDIFVFSRIIEDVLTMSAERIKKKNIQIYINDDHLLKTRANKVQITQVLINLINNAIDAVQELDEKWIRITVEKKNTVLQISVIDSGKGISRDITENMMKPFYTTKDPASGTGLGLSISKSIMEKNDGTLYYDHFSQNTKFVILLPFEE